MLTTWILAWGHVISAICWLGGGIVFGFVVAPALARLSPASSGEFLVKVVPSVVRFFQIFAGLTIVFGFLLLYSMGGSSQLSQSTFYGLDLSIGIVVALAAFVVAEFVAAPLQLKAVRQVKEMLASGSHEPPAEFPRTLRLASLTARLTAVLLVLASIFMVGAGFY
ncbi:MAG: DUF4149 domain-containing protein [Thermoplasmata archaeon]|nr:DUF4149 domain-containing protein [Thermoplasmata archaeon]